MSKTVTRTAMIEITVDTEWLTADPEWTAEQTWGYVEAQLKRNLHSYSRDPQTIGAPRLSWLEWGSDGPS